MRYPLDNPQVRLGFGRIQGYPRNNGFHEGIDYVAPLGTPLYPVRRSTVSYINRNDQYMGNAIELDIGGGLYTRYLHCSEILVSKGQVVDEGTVIAKAGFSGYVSPPDINGSHLHAELYTKVNGNPNFNDFRDINQFLKDNGAKAVGDKPMTPQQENEAYQIVLERPMEHGGSGRTGFEFIKAAIPELTAKRSAIAQTIQGLQEALRNEQNRPPKEVIKEVEKVVTEYVDRPVEIVKYVEVEPSWLTRLKNFFKNLKIKKG